MQEFELFHHTLHIAQYLSLGPSVFSKIWIAVKLGLKCWLCLRLKYVLMKICEDTEEEFI